MHETTSERVVRLLLRDVEATLGRSGLEEAVRFLRHDFALNPQRADYPEEIVGTLQTHIHDCFIDTTWPACPRHRTHPLWFGQQDSWWCSTDGEVIAALGGLGNR